MSEPASNARPLPGWAALSLVAALALGAWGASYLLGVGIASAFGAELDPNVIACSTSTGERCKVTVDDKGGRHIEMLSGNVIGSTDALSGITCTANHSACWTGTACPSGLVRSDNGTCVIKANPSDVFAPENMPPEDALQQAYQYCQGYFYSSGVCTPNSACTMDVPHYTYPKCDAIAKRWESSAWKKKDDLLDEAMKRLAIDHAKAFIDAVERAGGVGGSK
jgi:hypothetical protein